MSANRRHRRSRVWSTEGFWRRARGFRRETDRQWAVETDRDRRAERGQQLAASVAGAASRLRFRNDSGRTIRAGEAVYLTPMGGMTTAPHSDMVDSLRYAVEAAGLMEPPPIRATMPYSWVNPNGEVVRIYRE